MTKINILVSINFSHCIYFINNIKIQLKRFYFINCYNFKAFYNLHFK